MAHKAKIPVSDYMDLANFCRVKQLDLQLAVRDGLWTLTILRGEDVLVREQVRGEPYQVFDQLALDAVIGLAKHWA